MNLRRLAAGVLGAAAVIVIAQGWPASAGPVAGRLIVYGGLPECGTHNTPPCPAAASIGTVLVADAPPVVADGNPPIIDD